MVKEITEVWKCDICGDRPAESISFVYDRRLDAAGSLEDIYYDIDLCVLHLYEVHRILGSHDQLSMKQRLRSMIRGERWELKQQIDGIRRAWRKMSVQERALTKEILRLGVDNGNTTVTES